MARAAVEPGRRDRELGDVLQRHNGSPEAVARTVERWRPYRAVAARMLWQHYLARG